MYSCCWSEGALQSTITKLILATTIFQVHGWAHRHTSLFLCFCIIREQEGGANMHTRQKEETKWQWTVWDYAATKVHSVLLHSRDSHQRHSELSAPRTGSMQRSMRTRRPGYAGNSISHQSALLHLPVKPPPARSMIASAFLLATPKKAVLWVLHQLCVSVPEMLHNKMQPKKCWEGKREREEERKSNDLDSRGLSCKRKSRRCQAKYYQNRYPYDLRPWQSARPSPHISTLSQQIFLLLTPLLFATTDRPFFS